MMIDPDGDTFEEEGMPPLGKDGLKKFAKRITGVVSGSFGIKHADTRDLNMIGAVRLPRGLGDDGQPGRMDSMGLGTKFGDTPCNVQ
jgi:hypothetical protein